MKLSRRKNRACPRCGCRALIQLRETGEPKQYTISDPEVQKFFEKAGKAVECCDCSFIFHEFVKYDEFDYRPRTPVTREKYLKLLGDRLFNYLGEEDAMWHSLMYRFLKEKRAEYFLEDIELDFKKMLRRIELARRSKTKFNF